MRKTELGQALVIILLVMAVGLTIGLSIISRSITDIRIAQQEEESARAFSAAEAGIEQALIGGSLSGTIGGINYNVTPTTQGGGTTFDFGGGKFKEGDIQTVWLIEHTNGGLGGYSFPVSGSITVCWGANTANKIAIEASLIYKDAAGSFKMARGAYDADFGRGNEFDDADGVSGSYCGGSNLAFREIIDLDSSAPGDFGIPSGSTLYALRLKLFYNSSPEPIAVSGSDNFPSQGKCYESTATVPESGITRKVKQCQFHKVPPGIFDYVLFSGGDLVK